MYRIIDERSTGKTGRLMLIAKETGAYFVCAKPDGMRVKAKAYGIDGINFVSYSDFIYNFDPDITNYVVDELENFLKIVIKGPNLIGYTLSKD